MAVHGARLTMESMLAAVRALPQPAAEVLQPLCAMFAIEEIERGAAWLLAHDLLSAGQVKSIPDALNTLCDRITPHVPVLLDAFEIPQDILRVPISAGDHAMIDDPPRHLPVQRDDQPTLVTQ